jgi:hypothetical protein
MSEVAVSNRLGRLSREWLTEKLTIYLQALAQYHWETLTVRIRSRFRH